jgi:hypothetical protein
MREISAGQALGAGFRLIGREPAAFAAWCAVYFVLGVLPQGLVMGPSLSMMQALGSGNGPTSPAVLAAQEQMSRLQPVSLISGLLVFAVLPAAIFRAMLRPDDRGFLYLRLGMREVWMALSGLVVGVIWFMGILVAMLPTIAVAAVGAQGGPAGVLLAIPLFLGLFGVVLWALLRLSLAPVMSFADRVFRFPEAWRISKGHAGRMFLVALGLFVLAVVVEGVVFGVGFGLLASATPDFGRVLQTNPGSVFTRVGWPGMLVAGLLLSVVGGWYYTMGAAAWASMYRDLTHNEHDVFN